MINREPKVILYRWLVLLGSALIMVGLLGLLTMVLSQDEYTTIYGDENWTHYETYEFETDTWKRGTVYDMREDEYEFPSSNEIHEQMMLDSQEFRDWSNELRRGYEDVYRQQ